MTELTNCEAATCPHEAWIYIDAAWWCEEHSDHVLEDIFDRHIGESHIGESHIGAQTTWEKATIWAVRMGESIAEVPNRWVLTAGYTGTDEWTCPDRCQYEAAYCPVCEDGLPE